MSESERPDHALLLDLTRVLREFSDRQSEMAQVVRQLRTEISSALPSAERAGLGPTAEVGPLSVPPAAVESGRVPPAVTGSGDAVQATMEPAVTEPATPTQRDYDYFAELDARLAGMTKVSNAGTDEPGRSPDLQ